MNSDWTMAGLPVAGAVWSARTATARAAATTRTAAALGIVAAELGGLLGEAGLHSFLHGYALRRGKVANLLRDLHAAELRPAHRAEVRDLGAVGRQRLIMKRARRDGIERQVEL